MVSFLISGSPAAGDDKKEPIATDRPDFTETAETVPFGMSQIESGYTFSRNGAERAHSIGELLLRIATGRRTELRLGINSFAAALGPGRNLSGFEDMSVGFKLKLIDGDLSNGFRRPNVALIGGVTVPTGSSAYRENTVQPESKLCLAWQLSERVSLGSNLNYGLPTENGSRFSQFSGTLSFGYALSNRHAAYLEYFAFIPGGRGGPNTSYLDGGMTFLVNDDFQLDARAGIGMNSTSPDYFVGLGAARRW